MTAAPTQTAPTMEPTVSLTPAQIAFYHREGYLALEAITTQEETAWLRGIYDHLFASQAGGLKAISSIWAARTRRARRRFCRRF